MILKDLISYLSERDPNIKVTIGFDHPHSYRGYYSELAFEIHPSTTVGEMLECAKGALGSTYIGWKGGEYTMTEFCDCYLVAGEGCTGEGIGVTLLGYMVGEIERGYA